MKYTGEKCFSCGEPFDDSSDVVVCPDCGTPYHRDCYKQNGHCINNELHENGGSWKTDAPEVTDIKLPEDNAKSEDNVRREEDDNAEQYHDDPRISKTTDINVILRQIGVEEKDLFNENEDFGGGATLKELSQFVSSNIIYYIPMFKRFKDFKMKTSFNLTAVLFPYIFFAMRKMWFWSIITAVITTLLNVPSIIYLLGDGEYSPVAGFINANFNVDSDFMMMLMDICRIGEWVLRVLAGLFANWIYMKFAVKSVNKVKAKYGGPVSPQRLRAMGGRQLLNVLLILLIVLAMEMAVTTLILAFMMFVI